MDYMAYTKNLQARNLELRHFIHEIGGYRYNWHDEIEVMLILYGCAQVCVEGKVFCVAKDDLLVINSKQGHASLRQQEKCVAMVLHIPPSFFEGIVENIGTLWFVCNSTLDEKNKLAYSQLRKLLCKMFIVWGKEDPYATVEGIGYLNLFAAELLKHFASVENDFEQHSKQDKKKEQQIKKVLKFIEDNYTKKLTLEEIAKYAKYNESYLSTLFKKALGISFYKYLTRVRMQHANVELLTTDKPIHAIALDNGFSDVKSFNAIFQENFLIRPSEYRKAQRNKVSDLSNLCRRFIPADDKEIQSYLRKYADEDELSKDLHSVEESRTGIIKLIVDPESYSMSPDLLEVLKNPLTLQINSMKEK
jgi:AraC-like DNA-binding protein